MKKIYLLLFIIVASLKLLAQQDSLSKAVDEKLQAFNDSLNEIKTKITHVDTSLQPLRDTIEKIISDQLIVDASALDSAQKFSKEILYKNYLLDKKNWSKGQLRWFYAIFSLFILVFMWIQCIRYSKNDALCKDVSFDRSGKRIDPKLSPYSYARAQLLWWTMIIFTCYIFFFGVTGVLFPLNVTSVLLLGFGAIVYGAGKVIDDQQIAEEKGTRNQDLGGQNYEAPNFIKDILSDDNGVSLHRFQAMIFNIVFGIGFIGYFIKGLIQYKYPFPDFTEWQFALIGISSATYLGLKAAENRDPEKRKVSSSAPNLRNESFPGDTNLSSLIEYHDASEISRKPPAAPPPNIK